MKYIYNLAIALDQLANAVFLGNPDETLSARAYRLSVERKRHWPRRIIDILFFWELNHCEASYLSELNNQRKYGIKQSHE